MSLHEPMAFSSPTLVSLRAHYFKAPSSACFPKYRVLDEPVRVPSTAGLEVCGSDFLCIRGSLCQTPHLRGSAREDPRASQLRVVVTSAREPCTQAAQLKNISILMASISLNTQSINEKMLDVSIIFAHRTVSSHNTAPITPSKMLWARHGRVCPSSCRPEAQYT